MLRRLVTAAALAAMSTACEGGLDTVPYVDTTQLQGTWFEIGHQPRSTQEGCAGTTATYTPVSNGHFAVMHQCTLPGGQTLQSTATLYVIDQKTNAKLGIDLGGFIGDYWIIDQASDYHYVVVGHPSRQYLWILARDKHLGQQDLDTILAHAKQNGFDTSVLEYTNQDGGTSPQSNSGCNASTAKRTSGGALAGLGALGLVAFLRRRKSR